jgi:hypothetical protein
VSVGGGGGTNTTNSEATRAQGDETIEPDGEATEHDISTAAESIDPNSESQLHVSLCLICFSRSFQFISDHGSRLTSQLRFFLILRWWGIIITIIWLDSQWVKHLGRKSIASPKLPLSYN